MLKSHRRFVLHSIADPQSQARCTGREVQRGGVIVICDRTACPRHRPDDYASMTARHTPESL